MSSLMPGLPFAAPPLGPGTGQEGEERTPRRQPKATGEASSFKPQASGKLQPAPLKSETRYLVSYRFGWSRWGRPIQTSFTPGEKFAPANDASRNEGQLRSSKLWSVTA